MIVTTGGTGGGGSVRRGDRLRRAPFPEHGSRGHSSRAGSSAAAGPVTPPGEARTGATGIASPYEPPAHLRPASLRPRPCPWHRARRLRRPGRRTAYPGTGHRPAAARIHRQQGGLHRAAGTAVRGGLPGGRRGRPGAVRIKGDGPSGDLRSGRVGARRAGAGGCSERRGRRAASARALARRSDRPRRRPPGRRPVPLPDTDVLGAAWRSSRPSGTR